jgi:hypothetical protein
MGRHKTVWVEIEGEPRARGRLKISDYRFYILDLESEISNLLAPSSDHGGQE